MPLYSRNLGHCMKVFTLPQRRELSTPAHLLPLGRGAKGRASPAPGFWVGGSATSSAAHHAGRAVERGHRAALRDCSAPSQHFTPGRFLSREPALPQKPPSISVDVQATEELTPCTHTRLGKHISLGSECLGCTGAKPEDVKALVCGEGGPGVPFPAPCAHPLFPSALPHAGDREAAVVCAAGFQQFFSHFLRTAALHGISAPCG